MIPFAYERAATVGEAVDRTGAPGSVLLAGGTELVNWMRLGVVGPSSVVDLKAVPGLADITADGGTVHIGPLAKLNDVAAHPLVAERMPVLTQAIHLAASGQLRYLATIGGNPLQSTRCPYFRSETPTPCNKRRPGSGCAARHGITDNQAIFGWTDDCIAVHPSDPGTALVAFDAVYTTRSAGGGRRIAARDLDTLPAEDPAAHNILRPGEVITDIEITGTAARSSYLKVRPRTSYEYARLPWRSCSISRTRWSDGRGSRSARWRCDRGGSTPPRSCSSGTASVPPLHSVPSRPGLPRRGRCRATTTRSSWLAMRSRGP